MKDPSALRVRPTAPIVKHFGENGEFPNSGPRPLVLYDQALSLPQKSAADAIERLIVSNGWGGAWRWGVYETHHYHSTAHECLLVYAGWVRVRFGGPGGWAGEARPGDVLLLPAGLSHKNIGSSRDFRTVGCYPAGQTPDLLYGKADERLEAKRRIAAVPAPRLDPIYGASSELMTRWRV